MLAAATAEEFWRGRAEPLLSRWPTVVVLLAYAAVLLAQIPATSLMPFFDSGSLVSGLSFALIAFGTLLFTVVMSFLLLNMTKERTELQHKINSLVDPLSGVANRRAFLDGAVAAFAGTQSTVSPLRSSCLISTGSRTSTIGWGMPLGIGCCRCLLQPRQRRSGRRFCSAALAAKNLLLSCR